MKLILKIIAMPFALALMITTAIFKFLLSVSAIFFGIASMFVFIGAVVLFIMGEPAGGIAFIVVAFLVSPFGLPALAGLLVGLMDGAGVVLRGFISG
jgi:hypothetical protein